MDIATAVVADQQNRALGGDPVEPADVGAEVQRREQPVARQLIADVVGVALIEVGLGNSGEDLLPGPIDDVPHTRHVRSLAQVNWRLKMFANLRSRRGSHPMSLLRNGAPVWEQLRAIEDDIGRGASTAWGQPFEAVVAVREHRSFRSPQGTVGLVSREGEVGQDRGS